MTESLTRDAVTASAAFAGSDASVSLDAGWHLCTTRPHQAKHPDEIRPAAGWIAACVPGTLAAALAQAKRVDRAAPVRLDDRDAWYRLDFNRAGPHRLTFEGLATITEIWLNGALIAQSDSMFAPVILDVDLKGRDTLHLCFRALGPFLEGPRPRAKWRPKMVQPSSLNTIRTTLLGHMPGWSPAIEPIGPWRKIICERLASPGIDSVEVRASRTAGGGSLAVRLRLRNLPAAAVPRLDCHGHGTILQRDEAGICWGELELPDIEPWWPHTHGASPLYPVSLQCDGHSWSLGRVGFRSVAIDRGRDGEGFAVLFNGERIFCRGACWTPPDLVGLSSGRSLYEPLLRLAVEAGFNMLRVGGTMVYESEAFFELCDELGLLVWHDFMFANFDYPAKDEAFLASIRREAGAFLERTRTSPALCLLCGGSEVFQQAAMLGLPETAWRNPIFDEILPGLVAAIRPDVPYVPNAPSGGALPFFANSGISHYYGVGAYLRPLEDARRAGLRFAAECLAFANIPENATLRDHMPVPPVHHPAWKAAVPRDIGASWDFDDVRDHYLMTLFSSDPPRLRVEDPEAYLDCSRAATAHAMTACFSEWRRGGSTTSGALVWFMKDFVPGAGWGLIDSLGEPKSVFFALKQILQPVQILVTDEGVNGLDLHLINETSALRLVQVRLTCFREGEVRVVEGARDLELPPRSNTRLNACALIGAFFDLTYAYRFGPPAHDDVVAEMTDATNGAVLSRAFYFPHGFDRTRHALGLKAQLEQVEGTWLLTLRTERFARFVAIDDQWFRPSDNWFHLAPGTARTIFLEPRSACPGRPVGTVRALNAAVATTYGDRR